MKDFFFISFVQFRRRERIGRNTMAAFVAVRREGEGFV
jgi:hypothetical protein